MIEKNRSQGVEYTPSIADVLDSLRSVLFNHLAYRQDYFLSRIIASIAILGLFHLRNLTQSCQLIVLRVPTLYSSIDSFLPLSRGLLLLFFAFLLQLGKSLL